MAEKICTCCRNKRMNDGKLPRNLTAVYILEDEDPVYFCDFCDGDALRSAKAVVTKRHSGE